MNKFTVKIGNTDYSNAIFPFKYGDFLDEQLDYATLTLARVKKAFFAPATPVFIEIESVTNGVRKFKRLQYAIATDNAVESPVGSGEYRHNLTLIEPTKYLEIPLETLCFTNAGARNYKETIPPIQITENLRPDNFELKFEESGIKSPVNKKEIVLPSPNSLLIGKYGDTWLDTNKNYIMSGRISVDNSDGLNEYPFLTDADGIDGYFDARDTLKIRIPNGTTKITYSIERKESSIALYESRIVFNFNIVYVPVVQSLIPWSVKDVIDRILQVQKPLRVKFDNNGNAIDAVPKFKFDMSNLTDQQKRLLTEHNCPEFTFTRNTTREALKKIGGYIHAEPRVIWNEEDEEFTTIRFDFFGGNEYATYGGGKRLSGYNYENVTNKWNIEQGCNELDAYVDNLVNRLNKQATIGQPYEGGAQTLRTENAYLRYEDTDGTMYFSTQYPIYELQKFSLLHNGQKYDLTPYIYESNIYQTQLSSYEDVYPISKAYGLYYTLGQEGLRGFFFKNTEITGGVLAQYAIVNIIQIAAGVSISQDLNTYKNLKFELVYTPIYSARVNHSKTYLDDWLPTERVINYAQGDNQVEVQYFGENIKGAVERLGTLERLYTFTCFDVDTIPKAGQLWDDDYYISTVSVEVMHDKFKVTCGLSKSFNRLSQYVGVSSFKRVYEVSERMVQERNILWKDYIVVGDYNRNAPTLPQGELIEDNCVRDSFWNGLVEELTDAHIVESRVSAFVLIGYRQDGEEISQVLLPAISAAEGNVIEYSTEYKDNFSAGQKRVDLSSGDSYGVEVEYSDYYGRMYYLDWYAVKGTLNEEEASSYPAIKNYIDYLGGANKESCVMSTNDYMQLVRKDGREKLKFTASVQFVSANSSYVIGSALARYHPSVGHINEKPILVCLKNRIGKFTKLIDTDDIAFYYEAHGGMIDVAILDANGIRVAPIYADKDYPSEAQSWALITPIKTQETVYSDEIGNNITVKEKIGGELLIGKNEYISGDEGDVICSGFAMYAIHNIYKLINKDKN